MRILYLSLFLLSNIFVCLTANSAVNDEKSCVFFSEAGLRMESYEYRETDKKNQLIDKEDGLLPGLQLGLGVNCHQWEFSVKGSQQNALLDYDGQTNGGRKLATRTLENISDVSAQAERRFAVGDTHSVGLYAGAGHWQWQRNIASVGNVAGLDEKYRWRFYYLGGNLSLLEKNPHLLMFDIRLLRMTQARLSVDFRGLFDKPQDLTLDVRNGWRVALPWRYSVDASNSMRLEPYVQGWQIDSTAQYPLYIGGREVGRFSEPASKTRLYGFTLNWLHYF